MSLLFSEAEGRSVELNHNGNRIDTTLGDLIAAISDVAFEYAADTKEAYYLAHLVLAEILQGVSLESKTDDWHFSRSKFLN